MLDRSVTAICERKYMEVSNGRKKSVPFLKGVEYVPLYRFNRLPKEIQNNLVEFAMTLGDDVDFWIWENSLAGCIGTKEYSRQLGKGLGRLEAKKK